MEQLFTVRTLLREITAVSYISLLERRSVWTFIQVQKNAAETEDMLKKLESFGKRVPASILTEVARHSAMPDRSAF